MKTKKNVFVFGVLSPVGGNVTYCKEITHQLVREKFNVFLFVFGANTTGINPTVTIIHLGNEERLRTIIKNTFEVYVAIKSLLAKGIYPDIVITDLYRISTYFLLSKIFLSFPTPFQHIFQFHGSDTLERNFQGTSLKILSALERIKLYFEGKIVQRAHKVICFSKYAKSIAITHLRVKNEQLYLTNPGPGEIYISKDTRKSARKKLGLGTVKKIILLIGRIEDRKGFPLFLSLLAKNDKKLSNVLFIFATDLKNQNFQYLSLPSSPNILIKHRPTVEEKTLLYKAADLTVLPSLGLETFGFVTLESLLCGTPVVAYDIGANSELIEKRFLADIKNPTSILDIIEKFFYRKKELQDLCLIEGKKLQKEYDWKLYLDAINIYK